MYLYSNLNNILKILLYFITITTAKKENKLHSRLTIIHNSSFSIYPYPYLEGGWEETI